MILIQSSLYCNLSAGLGPAWVPSDNLDLEWTKLEQAPCFSSIKYGSRHSLCAKQLAVCSNKSQSDKGQEDATMEVTHLRLYGKDKW